MERFTSLESDSSDEEVFFGTKVTLREIRRRVNLGRRTISVLSVSDESEESSVELIEAQSEPELLMNTPSPEKPLSVCRPGPRRSLSQPDLRVSLAPRTWESKITDESFQAMETLLTVEDSSSTGDELDTTLERIEKFLKVGRQEDENNVTVRKADVNTPSKANFTKGTGSSIKKPELKTPLFKTPLRLNRLKVPQSGVKLTPCRSPMRGPSPFENISSPVGFYIKHSPQVPLMQMVRPKKPLPHLSAIPKPVEASARSRNKENTGVNLPPKAYACAKQTKLIVTPDSKHLPKNEQVKKMASALPHPTVIRHERREKQPKARPTHLPRQDESFAKLSLSQADVSVCVVKSANITDTLKRN